eukprot:CAMPEP_0197197626 /NCGR_PEP_ID=MMETSP1423-20130617/32965_1 /TAXON_ID=476441 /ORGANISM="Pseudo-nitzschia heimii, Strain UNC1101" /LENGTH=113 /DNA_ID=CAMNT_0042651451 /DNA_START=412 /DNA_END=749 /DNA_ORIENTATION=+
MWRAVGEYEDEVYLDSGNESSAFEAVGRRRFRWDLEYCEREYGFIGFESLIRLGLCIRLENRGEVVASDVSDGDVERNAVFILPTECSSLDFVLGTKANATEDTTSFCSFGVR